MVSARFDLRKVIESGQQFAKSEQGMQRNRPKDDCGATLHGSRNLCQPPWESAFNPF